MIVNSIVLLVNLSFLVLLNYSFVSFQRCSKLIGLITNTVERSLIHLKEKITTTQTGFVSKGCRMKNNIFMRWAYRVTKLPKYLYIEKTLKHTSSLAKIIPTFIQTCDVNE